MAPTDSFIKDNICLRRLPLHLKQFIVDQCYEDYTPIDHAVWRYIMRRSVAFHGKYAHNSYLEGLRKTGISVDRIPDISEMNKILSEIGWAAVCVDGFIPPNAFMEFQAYNVLVIAADIRSLNHIEYTPAPDIVHEAAGHAPIIADPEYAEYLRLFGAIGSKAIISKRDDDLYEAIRQLSILKEDASSTDEQIAAAEQKVIDVQNDMGEPSEMAQLRNLHWWTVEYGLIGDLKNPKIYGAGLLSSIGESKSCLQPEVKKIPYSIEAAHYAFDITTQQPQLFVCNGFSQLTDVLQEFAEQMAFRTGGTEGLQKAIQSEAVATVELSSGLQISGVFSSYITNEDHEAIYFNTSGPTVLCEIERLMIGHGPESHADGFGSPIGKLKGMDRPLEDYSLSELPKYGIKIKQKCHLEFESGVEVQGILEYVRKNKYGQSLLMSFDECTVTYKDQVLFQPEWGKYDMAVGSEIVSVFAGSADKSEYDPDIFVSSTQTKRNSNHPKKLLDYYAEIEWMRSKKFNEKDLKALYLGISKNFKEDWLTRIELLELTQDQELIQQIKQDLDQISKQQPELQELISEGLKLLNI